MAKFVVREEFDLNGKSLGWSVYEGKVKRYGPCSTEDEAQKKLTS